MAFEKFTYIAVLISLVLNAAAGEDAGFSRKAFPSNFVFGVASSAYQYEGAYVEDGKGLSNWDVFSHTPGKIAEGDNGDMAEDQYHRYKEDVEIMSGMGVEMYRFSITWSRIFPEGAGEIDPLGVKYYNDLINELLSKGMQPFVTMSHYDIPQALEDQYGSWLNPRFADDFAEYAEACFKLFGDRVKYWTTFNEANVYAMKAYDIGVYPPSRCSHPFGNCSAGNSSTEPYIAMHNVLRAHAAAVDIYRRKYQAHQGGFIGIIISAEWFEPLRNIRKDFEAADRMIAFHNAWNLDPIVFGEYPDIMRKLVGERLPAITEDLRHKLRGSFDFIGLNYYSTHYATDASYFLNSSNRDYNEDSLATITNEKDGVLIGAQMYPPDMFGVPFGIDKILGYLKTRYSNPPIIITENGFGNKGNENLPFLKILNDTIRVDYIEETLKYVAKAIREGADVRGYFVWSLLDNFEWLYGYTSKFGMYHVDYTNGLQRYPKFSAHWYENFLKGKSLVHKQDSLREFMERYAGKAAPTIGEI